MFLFNLFRRKKETYSEVSDQLLDYICSHVQTKDSRIRAEDAIVVLGTILGERIIETAGVLLLEEHNFSPGASIFSGDVNYIIYGDATDYNIENFSTESVIGQIRSGLEESRYRLTEFPSIEQVIKSYANDVGDNEKWGKCSWLVSKENWPFILPLREGYETREKVDELLKSISDSSLRIKIIVSALCRLLKMVSDVIDHGTALMLTIQSINASSKMATMTDSAMQHYLLTGEYPENKT